jgi:hypothetical protein
VAQGAAVKTCALLVAMALAGCEEVTPGSEEHALQMRTFQRRPGESVVNHCIRTGGQYHAGVIAGQAAEWCTWRRW